MKKSSLSTLKALAQNKDVYKTKMPLTVQPMLAVLTHDYFYNSDWLYECKFDGERCIAFKQGNTVILKSRNDKSLNNSYPEIKDAIAALPSVKTAIFDGEVVAFKNGVTSFERLQPRMQANQANKKSKVAVYYYIFDLLYIDGYDVTNMPLIERKRLLEKLFTFKNPLRYSTHKFKSSPAYFKAVCKKGWEGLMVKNAESPYVHKRSSAWLKFKCIEEQELVIGGFTDPQGARSGFGALLVGYYKNNKLHFAGKVGTGFDQKTLRNLYAQFKPLIIKKSPFVNYQGSTRQVHWLRPNLVCEVAFTEWTRGNKLRHPRYLGLRRDKSAKKVVQEL